LFSAKNRLIVNDKLFHNSESMQKQVILTFLPFFYRADWAMTFLVDLLDDELDASN